MRIIECVPFILYCDIFIFYFALLSTHYVIKLYSF